VLIYGDILMVLGTVLLIIYAYSVTKVTKHLSILYNTDSLSLVIGTVEKPGVLCSNY